MTAAVFDGPGRPLRLERFPRQRPQPGEAVVRVRLCTLCGSDLHTFAGRRGEPTPCVLGHEVVGTVAELGSALTDLRGEPLRVGDRVVWAVAVACGRCFFCANDLPQKCEALVKFGKVPVTDGRPPFGGLATHCHLPAGAAIARVPAAVADELAAPAMCATATVAGAVRLAGDLAGRSVLVFGAGLLGLTACAMASAAGAASVTASDPDAARLIVARQFGATGEVPARGADVVFEMSGSVAGVAGALDRVRVGGTVVLAGSVSPTEPVPVYPEQLVRRCLTVRGVHNYHPRDLLAALDFLAAHGNRFPFADLVARRFPLAAVEEAFRFAEEHRPVRVGVVP